MEERGRNGKTSVREGSYSSKSRLEVKARNSDSKQGRGVSHSSQDDCENIQAMNCMDVGCVVGRATGWFLI